MNHTQLENVFNYLLAQFKSSPSNWTTDNIKSFCEYARLEWAVQILQPTITPLTPNFKNSNIDEVQQNIVFFPSLQSTGQQSNQKLVRSKTISVAHKLSILDVCETSFDDLFEICSNCACFKMVEDCNHYFQIQKLKIWSYLLLLSHQHRINLKIYLQRPKFELTEKHTQDEDIIAEIQGYLDLFIRSIFENPDANRQSKISQLNVQDANSIDEYILERNSKNFNASLYINRSMVDLLLNNLQHLPSSDSIYWDTEEVMEFLLIIKLDNTKDTFSINQIDGFILQILVNTPLKEKNLLQKCMLLNTLNSNEVPNTDSNKIMTSMSSARKYEQFYQISYLLHYLLTFLHLNFQNNNQKCDQYNLNQYKQVSFYDWFNLYYFSQIQQEVNTRRNTLANPFDNNKRRISQIKQQEQKVNNHPELQKGETFTFDQEKWFNRNQYSVHIDQVEGDSNLDDINSALYNSPQVNSTTFNPTESSNQIDNVSRRLKTQSSIGSILNSSVLLDEPQTVIFEQGHHNNSQNQLQLPPGSVLMEQGSVLLTTHQESLLLPQGSVIMPHGSIAQGSVRMPQGSVIMPQGSVIMPQGSVIMPQGQMNNNQSSSKTSPIKDRSPYNLKFVSQSQAELQQQQRENSIRRSSHLNLLMGRSLVPIFPPLELQVSNQIKIVQDPNLKKIITIDLTGASFGRGDGNTVQLVEMTKVSAKHAKIIFHKNKFQIQDQGSKRGTYFKVRNNFKLGEQMCFYIGDKFVFKILAIQSDKEEEGEIQLSLEKDSDDQINSIKLKQNEVWSLGRDKKNNTYSLEGYPCYPLMSFKHLTISYQMNWETGEPYFCMDDLNSRNGTWVRLSDKQSKSAPFQLHKKSRFNFAFEVFYEVIEIFYDL